MPDDDRPLGGAELDDHALQLFGADKHSRGGKLGDLFVAFMLRRNHSGVCGDPIFNGADWVFDERLPDPGVVPLDIYMSERDHGDLFLTLIRLGARSGLAYDPGPLLGPTPLLDPMPPFGYPASLEFTEWMVRDQKMIDRGERSDWQPGERLELHHNAWVRGADIFMPALDARGRLIPGLVEAGAEPIVFKSAWGLLKDVAVFRSLLGLASTATAARVPRDGTADRSLLPTGTWYDGTMRIDFGRNLLFVPSYDQAKPWVPRFEDIFLLNLALHPETVEQSSFPELDAADPKYPGPWSRDEWSAGINPNIWAKWRDADAFEKCGEYGFTIEANRRLCDHLRADIDAGEIALGIPVSPFEGPKMVDRQTLPEVVKAISFMPTRPAIPIETVMVPYGKEEYEVRIYRPERLAPVFAEAETGQPGRGEKVGSSANTEDVTPHKTLETKIIDEYEKIFGEKNPPKTYTGYAELIKDRIKYARDVSNIGRRIRMLRKDGKIKSIE